ncbi:unnamed protein product [Brachionus calyciflorus]|uniref:PLAT domain-containing protein n=1 Tax=Brachionus calyciflorus TaxID=104777 RepID=A0A813ZTE9_9BILA|nr:unnamed protein product [Brachionus calyciflorus]
MSVILPPINIKTSPNKSSACSTCKLKRCYNCEFRLKAELNKFQRELTNQFIKEDKFQPNSLENVKYRITIKTSENSPEEFNGNLGINIIAKFFDTGFIKLDKNISLRKNSTNFFNRGKIDSFQFEEQDIRTISAIILSKDVKEDESLYIDFVEIEILRYSEKKSFRFPIDGWIRKSIQEPRAEKLKLRYGKRNSLVVFLNEKPKFEYKIKISPRRNNEEHFAKLKLRSESKKKGRVIFQIFGDKMKTELFTLTDNETSHSDYKLYTRTFNDLGMIKSFYIKYDNRDYFDEMYFDFIEIIDPRGNSFKFLMNLILASGQEITLPKHASKKSELSNYGDNEEIINETESQEEYKQDEFFENEEFIEN